MNTNLKNLLYGGEKSEVKMANASFARKYLKDEFIPSGSTEN